VTPSTASLVSSLAHELYEAERDRTALPPIGQRHPRLTSRDAYAVQEAYADLRQGAGARLVGRKIGATSEAIQTLFGIDTPDYGHIFADMVVRDGGAILRDDLIQPMVEPELAFRLATELKGPGVRRADVLAATDAIVPCLEVIDSRIDDWRITYVDTVADNGSSARCVLGAPIPSPHGDLAEIVAELRRNERLVGRATGEAVLGHPADSVAWLANALGEYGHALEAGGYVLSGSFTTAVRAERGDVFRADFPGAGSVSCHFT
jgi:2-keto-4-pentenoate hydratase